MEVLEKDKERLKLTKVSVKKDFIPLKEAAFCCSLLQGIIYGVKWH